MLKITLLKTLYHEFGAPDITQGDMQDGYERRFRNITRSYDVSPSIRKVAVEERYGYNVVLYDLWVNDERQPSDLDRPDLLRWIYAFFQEYRPKYMKEGTNVSAVNTYVQLADCLDVDAMPSYLESRAYQDMEITTMEDVRNGKVKKDPRQANFPGLRFAKHYKRK